MSCDHLGQEAVRLMRQSADSSLDYGQERRDIATLQLKSVKQVHALTLKRYAEWREYCRGERADLAAKPADIPANPSGVYGDAFRQLGGMGAWLGKADRNVDSGDIR
jgi:hypothetical protein